MSGHLSLRPRLAQREPLIPLSAPYTSTSGPYPGGVVPFPDGIFHVPSGHHPEGLFRKHPSESTLSGMPFPLSPKVISICYLFRGCLT